MNALEPRLQTNRLELEIIDSSPVNDIFITLNHKSIAETISFLTWPMTMDQAQTWCQKSVAGQKSGREFLYIAYTKDGREPIGSICMLLEGDDPASGEIGYWVAEPWQGKGLASEMIRKLIEVSFGRLHLSAIVAKIAGWNTASMKAIEKFGFRQIGSDTKKTAKGQVLERQIFELRKTH
jgi:[ribosomal protein S5]-alanine N-acetyltransferase